MSNLTIKELQSRNEITKAFPVMRQLRTHLDESSYLNYLVKHKKEKEYKILT